MYILKQYAIFYLKLESPFFFFFKICNVQYGKVLKNKHCSLNCGRLNCHDIFGKYLLDV